MKSKVRTFLRLDIIYYLSPYKVNELRKLQLVIIINENFKLAGFWGFGVLGFCTSEEELEVLYRALTSKYIED